MITCDQALELISARLDEELNEADAAALDAHLAICEPCRALLADLEDIHEAMPSLYEPPPVELAGRIMEAVSQSKVTPLPQKHMRKKWHSWAALAAVCAVALVGAGTLNSFQHGGGSAAPAVPTSISVENGQAIEENQACSPALTALPPATAPSLDSAPVDEVQVAPASNDEQTLSDTQAPANKQTSGSIAIPDRGQSPTVRNQQEIRVTASTPDTTSAPPAVTDPPTPSMEPPAPRLFLQPQEEETPPSEPSIQPSAPPEPAPLPQATTLPGPYVGILSLPYDSAPDLSAYPSTTEHNVVRYLLPATEFTALAETLSTTEGVVWEISSPNISSDATEGMVVVLLPEDNSSDTE